MVKKQNTFKLYVLIKVASLGFFIFYFKVKQVSADKFSFIQQGLHTNGKTVSKFFIFGEVGVS